LRKLAKKLSKKFLEQQFRCPVTHNLLLGGHKLWYSGIGIDIINRKKPIDINNLRFVSIPIALDRSKFPQSQTKNLVNYKPQNQNQVIAYQLASRIKDLIEDDLCYLPISGSSFCEYYGGQSYSNDKPIRLFCCYSLSELQFVRRENRSCLNKICSADIDFKTECIIFRYGSRIFPEVFGGDRINYFDPNNDLVDRCKSAILYAFNSSARPAMSRTWVDGDFGTKILLGNIF